MSGTTWRAAPKRARKKDDPVLVSAALAKAPVEVVVLHRRGVAETAGLRLAMNSVGTPSFER